MARIRCSVCRLAQQDTLRVALHGLTVDWGLHPARTRVASFPLPGRQMLHNAAVDTPAPLSSLRRFFR